MDIDPDPSLVCECGKSFKRKDNLKRHRDASICDAHNEAKKLAKRQKLDNVILTARHGEDLEKLVNGLQSCTYVK